MKVVASSAIEHMRLQPSPLLVSLGVVVVPGASSKGKRKMSVVLALLLCQANGTKQQAYAFRHRRTILISRL